MICRADKSDIGQLKLIWRQIFEDDEKVIDKFFSLVYDKSRTYVWREHDEIESVLYMIPKGRGVYLYALATLPRCRKRGIMSSLIEHSLADADEAGAEYAFLIPAEQELCHYYEKFGFDKKMTMLHMTLGEGVDTYGITMEEYLAFAGNSDFLYSDDPVICEPSLMEFVLYEHISEGHMPVKILYNGMTAGVAVLDGDGRVMHYVLKKDLRHIINITEDKNHTAIAVRLNGNVPENACGYIPF